MLAHLRAEGKGTGPQRVAAVWAEAQALAAKPARARKSPAKRRKAPARKAS